MGKVNDNFVNVHIGCVTLVFKLACRHGKTYPSAT